jgi:erythromycin esterase-like protein
MAIDAHKALVQEIRSAAIPLSGKIEDYTSLLEESGKARFVLIGEATHGTDDFYRIRAELTKQLILHHGFAAIAAESDWPDSYRINRYVRGAEDIHNAQSALAEFVRFPSWMWRNEVMVEFVDWLRQHNARISSPSARIGFYGLDLYSLQASIQAVIQYLEKIDPPAAERARLYYGCFDHLAEEPQQYGYASSIGLTEPCEQDVVQQLINLRRRSYDYIKRDGFVMEEEYFCAEQNAKVVVGAEEYYRTMFKGRVSSWNLRDRHMAETLQALAAHLSDWRSEEAKVVVWAHNSHIGDARATEMGEKGEWNIGQLMRDYYGKAAYLIGFSTYSGIVTAASNWDGEAERKIVRPGMKESYEGLFHDVGMPDFLLFPRANATLAEHLNLSRLQRAIGVIYVPETERWSHYFFSKLPEQFDAMIHIDTTKALKPLEPKGLWHKGEVFETYPSGM